MNRLVPLALLGVAAIASTGCSPSLKYFKFKVWEDNRQVYVEKFFNDGFGAAAHATAAYEAAENGDNDSAIKIMKGHIDHQGGDSWDYYDLAILYERRHRWNDAEDAMKQAINLDKHDGDKHVDADLPKELKLIRYYRDEEQKHSGQ